MYTEEKAKVVAAAAWGTDLLQLLAALPILHQDDWCKWSYSSYRPGKIYLQGIEAILYPNQQRRHLPSVLYKSIFHMM